MPGERLNALQFYEVLPISWKLLYFIIIQL